MSGFKEISVEELKFNAFTVINKGWMLVTAGNSEKCNTMTASWGALGELWNSYVSMIFIRPQRYTLGFIEKENYYSLCFFDESKRSALNYCGSHSGRDGDKFKAAGLTPAYDEAAPYFKEARLVLICRKLYGQQLEPSCLADKTIDAKCYASKDYHKEFIGSIEKALIRE
ncbi:MAG TPA: flavin reductase [Ruminococcaceae bacterium]|nr:flavin reductase [Oscillospiraceae bacterium]